MTPHFLGDYATAVEWFGEECPCFAADHAKARPFDVARRWTAMPPLIHERLMQFPALEQTHAACSSRLPGPGTAPRLSCALLALTARSISPAGDRRTAWGA